MLPISSIFKTEREQDVRRTEPWSRVASWNPTAKTLPTGESVLAISGTLGMTVWRSIPSKHVADPEEAP